MALYKRKKTWWTDFAVNGQRSRMSLDTSDWREAQRLEREKISDAQQGKLEPSGQQFARLAFAEAAKKYQAERLAHLSPRSIVTERERLKPLTAYFASARLSRISVESVSAYVSRRKAAGVGNRTVNLEIGVLRRVLKRAKLWHRVADEIRPLPERRDIGRALDEDQKLRLIKMAQRKPEWQVARLAMTLALNTTMRACEIRGLRWRDVDFLGRSMVIRRSKTEAGERLIPLNRTALAAILELRERSKALFGDNLLKDWFVFPHAEGFVNPDPSKPMSGWRTARRRLTRVVECPQCNKLQQPGMMCVNDKCRSDIRKVKSPTAGLRFHDLRHHAITELAESQTSEQTIMAIAGHVSPRMLAHYSHVRVEAKRKALDGLCSAPGDQGGYVTSHGTNGTKEKGGNSQVVENMVDVGRLELPTPCLQSRCSAS